MPSDGDPHGPDWRAQVRASRLFACLVTPAWYRDALCQHQLAYARELGKPIYFVVPRGSSAPLPVREPGESLLLVDGPESAAALLRAIVREGEEHATD